MIESNNHLLESRICALSICSGLNWAGLLIWPGMVALIHLSGVSFQSSWELTDWNGVFPVLSHLSVGQSRLTHTVVQAGYVEWEERCKLSWDTDFKVSNSIYLHFIEWFKSKIRRGGETLTPYLIGGWKLATVLVIYPRQSQHSSDVWVWNLYINATFLFTA
jgi:hypothetical protein